ncbi:MAG: hypothetical protein K1X89_24875, partial [Myxococcaceae bacterium]|nr:hypothetical protein [Myxococcaceae bacterium]
MNASTRTLGLAVSTISLLLLGGCGASVPATNQCAAICAGCCDSAGKCQSGLVVDSCGKQGAMCTACGPGMGCLGGVCSSPSGSGGGSGASGGGTESSGGGTASSGGGTESSGGGTASSSGGGTASSSGG